MSSVIHIENLYFTYERKQKTVLDHISFDIGTGERIGLIGSNGAGKSTLLKILTGILLPVSGTAEIAEIEINAKSLNDIRKHIGYVFQDSDAQLFMPTVYKDVSFAMQNYGYSKDEIEQRTMEALHRVHMEDYKDRQIYRLSEGQKKLAAIAGVLTLNPDIILMDEPSAGLDPKNRRNLIHIINDLPCAAFIASHDLDFIYDTCDRILLLHDSHIVKDGPKESILKDKELLEACDLELPLAFQKHD